MATVAARSDGIYVGGVRGGECQPATASVGECDVLRQWPHLGEAEAVRQEGTQSHQWTVQTSCVPTGALQCFDQVSWHAQRRPRAAACKGHANAAVGQSLEGAGDAGGRCGGVPCPGGNGRGNSGGAVGGSAQGGGLDEEGDGGLDGGGSVGDRDGGNGGVHGGGWGQFATE